jgi:hypothetical protein
MVKLRVHGFAISIDGYGAGRGQDLAIAPILLGSGENLLAGIDLPLLGYQLSEHVATEGATHFVLSKRPRRYHGDTTLRDLGAADPIAR